ncbi:MAG TPA: hypothetical protein VGM90_36805 [Kofleriaceae bacterium]|jgi:hypothetical protein
MRFTLAAFAFVVACSGPSSTPPVEPSPPAPVVPVEATVPVDATAMSADAAPIATPDAPQTASTGSDVATAPDGDNAACRKATDCASGVCEGEGCGDAALGHCAPAKRGCTRDRREYCGCDGHAFFGSSSCPGLRYKSKGKCVP